jgi:hypothetical protein
MKHDREAEQVLRAYLRRPHSPPLEAAARLALARSLISLGRGPEARAELERVTRELPSSPQALEALELLRSLK